jgi:hypothetical protein
VHSHREAPPSPVHTPTRPYACVRRRAVNVNRRERVKPGTFEDRGGTRWVPEAATRCGSGLRGRLDALAWCRCQKHI